MIFGIPLGSAIVFNGLASGAILVSNIWRGPIKMAMNDDEIARRKGLTFAQAVPAADAIEEDGGNVPRILLTGGREHLRLAVIELTNGNFADSVRESIHSVESVVRVLNRVVTSARRYRNLNRKPTSMPR